MAGGALSDVVVLELATGVAGPYCGRLLCDLGAQVIKLEPPEGDRCRNELPMVNGESAFYAWLNAGKLNVSLVREDSRVEVVAARADIVIHNDIGDTAIALESELQELNPAAVIVSLSPYGRSGERSEWQASPLTEYATSGYHYIAGDSEREPLALPGHHVEFHAGMHAATAVLAGLHYVREGGDGQLVEVSHQEAMLSDHAWLTTSWTHEGRIQRREGNQFVPCADGYIYLFGLAPSPNLFVMIDRLDMLEDEELLQPLVWRERLGEVLAAFAAWCATRTRDVIYHAAQELRIAVTPLNTMADVAVSEQLLAREWFSQIDVAGISLLAPGAPYRLMGTPCAMSSSAAAAGDDNDDVLGREFAWANEAKDEVSGEAEVHSGPGPLAGLRVIEVTANWAGPIGGRHLADLGADVIKIELSTKPATRALVFTGGQIWPDFHHRAGYFNKLNRNKRDISLDLTTPKGKELFLALVRDADVVLEKQRRQGDAPAGPELRGPPRGERLGRDVFAVWLWRHRPGAKLLGLWQQYRDHQWPHERPRLRAGRVLRDGYLLCRPGQRHPRRGGDPRGSPRRAPLGERAMDRYGPFGSRLPILLAGTADVRSDR